MIWRRPRKNDSDIDAVDLANGKVTTLITGGSQHLSGLVAGHEAHRLQENAG